MPRLPTEIDRLDLQHYALRLILAKDYFAPIGRPSSILDVGAGTGQWAFDLCEEFPEAMVVGLDVVESKSNRPGNYQLVKANLLHGLPFMNDSFKFTHQRLLFGAIPLADWKGLVADLVRVTLPGGWVELVELAEQVDDPGPALEQMYSLYRPLASARGLDTIGIMFRSLDRWLREAGLVSVVRKEVRLAVGEWGGRAGSLMLTDVRNGCQGLLGMLQRQGSITVEAGDELLLRVQRECEERKTRYPLVVVYGRKPT